MPLARNSGNPTPDNPDPQVYAQAASNTVATVIRQKFASVPPISRADRWPHRTESEKNIVVSNAANTGRES